MRLMFCMTVLALGGAAYAEAPPAAPAAPPDYSLALAHEPTHIEAGTNARLTVTLSPKAPWAIKTTTPLTAAFSASEGIELGRLKLTAKDFVDPKAADKSLVVPFLVKIAEGQKITLDLTFFLCSEQVCQRHKETREYPL